ncbi:LysR family transcriptional regulator [Pseudomonas fluorescens]|uniref:LysR family transcriptional regulator n=1 Tax=Pseudomonas fluorescens TaxID=294 RepID=UPI0021D03841|nr:LysR family transcriptional regulator [Pseudomonas fluorescens]UXV18036.1 LysR family transcriptional regulator [Pseudomonas fluorescens]
MDTSHLALFVETAQKGSFAAAARSFDIDPSAVTRAVTTLEKSLGLRLLERTTRRVALTEAGKIYYEHARKLLQDLAHASDQARDVVGSPAGIVRVTASVTFGYRVLIPLLPALRESFPEIEVDLLLSDTLVDLVGEGVDIALRLRQPTDTSMIGTRLAKIRYHVCASPEYLNRHGRPIQPSELAVHNCLRCSVHGHLSPWKFRDASGRVQEVSVDGWLVVSNSLAMHRAALDHQGPALLADWIVKEDLAAGKLINLFPNIEATPTDFDNVLWLLYTSRVYVPKRVRAFIEFMKDKIGEYV